MIKKLLVSALVAGMALSLSACQTMGGIVGAGVGAYAGSHVGGGSGRTIAMIVGGLIGHQVGQNVGVRLQAWVANDYNAAPVRNHIVTAPNGTYGRWRLEDGNTVSAVPQNTYRNGNQLCRDYTVTVSTAQGPVNARGVVCQAPDGNWYMRN